MIFDLPMEHDRGKCHSLSPAGILANRIIFTNSIHLAVLFTTSMMPGTLGRDPEKRESNGIKAPTREATIGMVQCSKRWGICSISAKTATLQLPGVLWERSLENDRNNLSIFYLDCITEELKLKPLKRSPNSIEKWGIKLFFSASTFVFIVAGG